MALTAGARLGPYEIVGRLGAGGMGEVYRARDTKLDRDVAIKILSEAFVADAARVARFEQEAKTLASLNHPNIAAIYGLEESGDATALVLELVEGPTLGDRIAFGPIPVDEALPIAKQIAEAVEAAHEQGIIHRDLKPANVKVRPDGTVKVLDFGLAKVIDAGTGSSASLSMSPTMTTPAMTQVGFILGTAAYMSPEQARGRPVDKRADIWAFGCVLVEMLTGKKVFEAEDVSLTLAAVMKSEPDWKSLPPLPPSVEMCLRQCLKKEPRQRLRDIGDARLALEGSFDPGVPADPANASPRSARRVWRWLMPAAAVSAMAAAFATLWFQPNPVPEVVRFEIHAPPGSRLPPGTPAISPDGRTIAYTVDGPNKVSLIHLRAIDSTESRGLPGTENAIHPFWSPDGRSLAFAATGKIKRIDLAGGPVRELGPTNAVWHGSWNQFGELLLVTPRWTFRIPAEGGTATPAIELNPKQGEAEAGFPIFLADGRHFLVRVANGEARSAIHLASLDSPDRKMILDNVFSAALVAPTPQGTYLMYMRDTALVAHEFDERTGAVRGNPRVIVENIGRVAAPPVMPTLGVSPSGAIAYQIGGEHLEVGLIWLDRSGTRLEELSPAASGLNLSLSPDGRRLVVDAFSARGNRDLWVTDLDRGATTRLTFAEATDVGGVWSHDGRVAFRRSSKIYVKSADGSNDETVLSDVNGRPTSWSTDGKYLLYETPERTLFLLPLTGGQKPIAVGSPNGSSRYGQFSSDGRYIVYSSDESGRYEVYVQSLPPATGKWKVSLNGGDQPRWSRKSGEIFFVSPDETMMAVDVRAGQTISAGVPRKLFQTGPPINNFSYDVSADGQRFLVTQRRATIPDKPITVVLNWWAELAKRQN